MHASHSLLLLATATLWLSLHPVVTGDENTARYARDIHPIIESKCFKCHASSKQKAGLNLSSLATLVKGGESGSPVVAGKPDDSLLFERVRDGEMPPDGEGELSAEEIDSIRRWIADGVEIKAVRAQRRITQHEIVPLMLLRCTVCHGGRRKEADLDLRTREGMLKGGKSGPAVTVGKPEESLIIKRIRAEEMPPRRELVAVSVKPMEAGELAKLEAWIAAGLPESSLRPDIATTQPDSLVSDEDRQYWSFQPLTASVAPSDGLTTADLQSAQNTIDRFIVARQRERQLSMAKPADRTTLIRRVYFDLIGLPPTPSEVERFATNADPLAYEQLVDRLLASPRYGERWGRHWLDVAGYADSEGSQNEDRIRPRMWRYRDYVVRAFNADKPYDRFLHEQIAGDELADYENATVITDDIYDNLVATGFLRTAPDRTFAGITNFVPDRLELIADEIQILGSAVMGLTLHCARCHSHKFDPIPQRDYYRLAATLRDALDEHDWLGPQSRSLKYVTTAERQAWEQHEAEIGDRVAQLKKNLEAEKDAAVKKKLEEQIQQIESERKPEPRIRALWARGTPSPTYLLKRGNYLTPGEEVGPGVPSVLTDGKTPFAVKPPWSEAKTTGRRLAFARWLTEPNHPLTARVMVNRIWQHHFGRALVATPGNFGTAGATPTHPALLDHLAVEFIRQNWSVKAMHRLMVTSQTYRARSKVTPELLATDPDNQWYTRMPLRRLEAEALRDALLFVAGQLEETPFGPPDDVQVGDDGLVTSKPQPHGWRRSIYVLHRRTQMPTLLENFDSPQMGPNCVERDESIVAPQALHLLNNSMIHELASRFAHRVRSEVGSNIDEHIRRIHQVALGREPTNGERSAAKELLGELTQLWLTAIKVGPKATEIAANNALANYCHAVMNSAAFVYID